MLKYKEPMLKYEESMLKFKEQNLAILPLTIDRIFKMYFENPRNLPELKRFLKAYIDELDDEELSSIEMLNRELGKVNNNDKGFTVDLLIRTKSGNIYHIEMQTSGHKGFRTRVQLYNSRRAAQQIKVGEEYFEVKRTISLIVTNFSVFEDGDKSHEKIFMRRENGEIFTDAQELNIIDLTKPENNKEKNLWVKLFKVTTMEELDMVARESDEMAEAAEKLLLLSADERAQAYMQSRENAEFERRLREQDKFDEGREQGIDIGKVEIAKMMIRHGDSVEFITSRTGLSADLIEELKDQENKN